MTPNNSGAAIELPLTGSEELGSPYARSVSSWTLAPAGTKTYTALTAWLPRGDGPHGQAGDLDRAVGHAGPEDERELTLKG